MINSSYCPRESAQLKNDVKVGLQKGEFVDVDLGDGASSPTQVLDQRVTEAATAAINPNLNPK